MADTVAPAPKEWHRIVWKFNYGDEGWSEMLYLNRGTTDPQFHANIQNLTLLRAKLLGGYTSPSNPEENVKIRPRLICTNIANLNGKRQAEPFYSNDAILDANVANFATLDPAISYSLMCQDKERRYRRTFHLRCLPAPWVPEAAAFDEAAPINSEFLTALDLFRNALTNFDENGSVRSGPRFALLVDAKVEPAERFAITAIAKNPASGEWTIRAPGTAFAVGDHIVVGGVYGRGVKGINDTHEVLTVSDPDMGEYVLSEPACDPCPPKPTTMGTVHQRKLDVPEIYFATQWLWGRKPLGRAFFTSAGRQSKKCC